VDIGDSLTVPEAIEELSKDPTVQSVEPNIIRRVTVVPNDPDYEDQWHLQAAAGVNGPDAWDMQTGSADVVVAVVDTGVDTDHEDLADNIWVNPGEIADNDHDDDGNGYVDDVNGYDFADNDSDPNPSPDGINNDSFGGIDNGVTHGTHVAGIIAAVGDNGVGGSGVAWHTSIMAVRVLDDEGSGTDADIAEGIIYAADLGVDIISMSLGGYGSTSVLEDAVEYAREHGVLVIAATGNDDVNIDDNPFYPACYTGVVGVAATDDQDNAAWFSNFGSGCTDISAPGDTIYSTLYTDDPTHDFTDDYGYMSGTSMATPVVSGVASLVKANDMSLTADEVSDVVTLNAEDIGLTDDYGRGRVDAYLALQGTSVLNRPSSVDGVLAYADDTLQESYTSGDRQNDTQPYFAWNPATDDVEVVGYYVYFGTDASADPEEDGVFQTERHYTPEAISGDDVSYYIRVEAKDSEGNVSSDVASFEYVIDTTVDAPTNVTVHSGGHGVNVLWTRVTQQHVRRYRVFRRLAGTDDAFTSIGKTKNTKEIFSDTHVRRGVSYEYEVRAVDDVGNKATSDAVSITFTPRERVVIAAGPGVGPLVRIYNPKTQQITHSWYAANPDSRTGLHVAVGNVDQDKRDEVIIGFDAGGEPRVKVFDADGTLLESFLAYDADFRGGVRVAVGDVNRDGVDDIITAPGSGMSPVIKVFNKKGNTIVDSFTAFDGTFAGGTYVSALNWDGEDGDEIAVSAGETGGPQVILYNPRNGREIRSFFAYDHDYHGGVQTVGLDRENDDADALIVAPLDGVADIHRYEPRDPENTILALSPFNGFVTDYTGGAVVAAGRLGSSRTDSIAVANTGDRQATVNMYTATGGTLLDTVYPFGSYVGPVTIASGWVY
jgi:subtilisin family serine protease